MTLSTLASVLEAWVRTRQVTTARVTGDGADAARVLAAAGVQLHRPAAADAGSRALPRCDLVVSVGDLALARDWRGALTDLASQAAQLLIVVLPNPRALVDRIAGRPLGEVCRTDVVAPAMWALGRVRDHVYVDVPRFGHLAGRAVSVPRIEAALARRHVFVIDTAPRTPQARARRRLETV